MPAPRKRRPPKDEAAGEMRPKEAPQPEGADRFARLDAMGASLSRTRSEAISAKQASGIEAVWDEDDEHCEGIDDANRHLVTAGLQTKPPGQSMPKSQGAQSVEFPNITGPYVDAAAAKIGGILLPADERPWSLSETPIPEILQLKADGVLPLEVIEGMAEMNVSEEQALAVREAEKFAALEIIKQAKEKAEKAQKRIEDWHVEGQWTAEVRKVIEDACRIGSGVLKGPVPVSKRESMYTDGKLVLEDKIKPVSKRIDPRNLFPDGACGDNIHNGNYIWERDYITAKQLRAMKNDPDYISEQIELCLQEGPKKATESRKLTDGREISDKDIYEIWYYHGQATKEDLEAAGCTCKEGMESVPAIFTLVNDRVVKGALNPLDTGDFPYDVMPFKRRKNMPWGTGVSRLIRTPQRIVTAGTRVMMTNGGRAAGPIFILKNGVEGSDGTNDILPWKTFYAPNDDTQPDVRNSMAMLEIPDRFNSLMGIVQYGMQLAEKVTGLPLMLQGQMGDAPETLGGQQLASANASETLMRIATIFDDAVTEPHVRRYYRWLLQHGPDEEKGEFVIDARGSTYRVAQDIYKNETAQLLQASLNPAFGLDPEKCMAENLRATKKKPENFQLTDEQKQQRAQAQQQQAPDPALQVAEVRGKTEMAKVQANQQADMAELKAKAIEAEKQRQHEMKIAMMNRDTEMVRLANAQGISVATIKAQLAGKVMELKTQKELSQSKASAPQVAQPPTEPVGRAPNGQAYQK